jgi:phosphonate transport system substrate-binding protein
MKRLVLTVAAVTMLAASAQAARHPLTLGVIDGTTEKTMVAEMQPVLSHLQSSPTVDVRLQTFPSHDAIYAALKAGKIDLAFLGAVKYVEAHEEIGAIPLVAEGQKVRSYIVVPAGSPIKSPAELKGKTFGFGYPDSTTTHLIPLLLLSKHGVRKEDVQGTFVGNWPQKIIDELLAGKFAAAPASEYTFNKNRSKLRAIETSEPFAGPPIVARKGLDAKTTEHVRGLFLSYKPAAADRSAHFGSGVTAVTDEDYNRIRFLCKVLFGKTYH